MISRVKDFIENTFDRLFRFRATTINPFIRAYNDQTSRIYHTFLKNGEEKLERLVFLGRETRCSAEYIEKGEALAQKTYLKAAAAGYLAALAGTAAGVNARPVEILTLIAGAGVVKTAFNRRAAQRLMDDLDSRNALAKNLVSATEPAAAAQTETWQEELRAMLEKPGRTRRQAMDILRDTAEAAPDAARNAAAFLQTLDAAATIPELRSDVLKINALMAEKSALSGPSRR